MARNGYITVSLDFLGFGLSDGESKDILEARFEKPISVMDLIESVKKMEIVYKKELKYGATVLVQTDFDKENLISNHIVKCGDDIICLLKVLWN